MLNISQAIVLNGFYVLKFILQAYTNYTANAGNRH